MRSRHIPAVEGAGAYTAIETTPPRFTITAAIVTDPTE